MVSDDKWPGVLRSLEDRRFDYRTVQGIAGENGLTLTEARELLKRHAEEVYRYIPMDKHHDPDKWLYTSPNRPWSWREVLLRPLARFQEYCRIDHSRY